MSEETDLDRELSDSKVLKTVRHVISFVTNVLIGVTVVVCVWFACSSDKLTKFHWHVILCVLGYQFFMCQGVLVLSKYNIWSMYLNFNKRRHLHILLQMLGFILAATGTAFMLTGNRHFRTTHGSLGLCAVMTSIFSIFNGGLAHYAYKLTRPHGFWLKLFHYFSGILTLFLSAGALTTGFDYVIFQFWIQNNTSTDVLILITWLFTFSVTIEFWIAISRRLRKNF